MMSNRRNQYGKSTKIMALIETPREQETLDEIVGDAIKPARCFSAPRIWRQIFGAETAWEPLLWVRSRIFKAPP